MRDNEAEIQEDLVEYLDRRYPSAFTSTSLSIQEEEMRILVRQISDSTLSLSNLILVLMHNASRKKFHEQSIPLLTLSLEHLEDLNDQVVKLYDAVGLRFQGPVE